MSGRATGLDLLRAMAISAVMLYHASSHGIHLPAVVEHGWMGVDLFFALSGYLVGRQLLRRLAAGEPLPWRDFMLGRALRILPAYYAVLLVYVLLPALGPGLREGGGLQPLWKFMSLTLNLDPDWERGRAYSHAWSLCVETHFYVALPVVLWLLRRRARDRAVVGLALAVVAGGLPLRAWLWQHRVVPLLDAGEGAAAVAVFVEKIYDPTWARLDPLLGGVLLAAVQAFRSAWWERLQRRAHWLLAAGVAVLAACTRIEGFSLAGAVALFPLAALGCVLLVAGAASPATFVGRHALPGMRACATLAFGLYLTHKQVYGLLDAWLPVPGDRAPWLALPVYGAASAVVALLLYVAVERPGLRLRARLRRTGAVRP